MQSILNYKQLPIKYLSHNRFKSIYEMLKDSPSWQVCGEVIFGKPITEEEIRFVAVKGGLIAS